MSRVASTRRSPGLSWTHRYGLDERRCAILCLVTTARHTHEVAHTDDGPKVPSAEAPWRSEVCLDAAVDVIHDVGNQLAVVLASLDEALVATGDTRPSLEDARRAAVFAGRLSRRFLALLARRDTLAPTAVDLADVVRELTPVLRAVLHRDVSFELELRSVRIVADPTVLQRMLVNLCANARDAVAGRDSPCVRIYVGPDPIARDDAVISVSDNGRGMDPSVRGRLGTRFVTTKGDRGTGLGLASVYATTAALGGAVTVVSELGRGTTFELHLPRVSS